MARVFKLDWRGDELLKKIDQATEPGLFKALGVLEKAATANAPRRTGALRKSAYIATSKRSTFQPGPLRRDRSGKLATNEGVMGFGIFYARFVETGTSKMAARSFLRRAFDSNKQKMAKTLADAIGDKLD